MLLLPHSNSSLQILLKYIVPISISAKTEQQDHDNFDYLIWGGNLSDGPHIDLTSTWGSLSLGIDCDPFDQLMDTDSLTLLGLP